MPTSFLDMKPVGDRRFQDPETGDVFEFRGIDPAKGTARLKRVPVDVETGVGGLERLRASFGGWDSDDRLRSWEAIRGKENVRLGERGEVEVFEPDRGQWVQVDEKGLSWGDLSDLVGKAPEIGASIGGATLALGAAPVGLSAAGLLGLSALGAGAGAGAGDAARQVADVLFPGGGEEKGLGERAQDIGQAALWGGLGEAGGQLLVRGAAKALRGTPKAAATLAAGASGAPREAIERLAGERGDKVWGLVGRYGEQIGPTAERAQGVLDRYGRNARKHFGKLMDEAVPKDAPFDPRPVQAALAEEMAEAGVVRGPNGELPVNTGIGRTSDVRRLLKWYEQELPAIRTVDDAIKAQRRLDDILRTAYQRPPGVPATNPERILKGVRARLREGLESAADAAGTGDAYRAAKAGYADAVERSKFLGKFFTDARAQSTARNISGEAKRQVREELQKIAEFLPGAADDIASLEDLAAARVFEDFIPHNKMDIGRGGAGLIGGLAVGNPWAGLATYVATRPAAIKYPIYGAGKVARRLAGALDNVDDATRGAKPGRAADSGFDIPPDIEPGTPPGGAPAATAGRASRVAEPSSAQAGPTPPASPPPPRGPRGPQGEGLDALRRAKGEWTQRIEEIKAREAELRATPQDQWTDEMWAQSRELRRQRVAAQRAIDGIDKTAGRPIEPAMPGAGDIGVEPAPRAWTDVAAGQMDELADEAVRLDEAIDAARIAGDQNAVRGLQMERESLSSRMSQLARSTSDRLSAEPPQSAVNAALESARQRVGAGNSTTVSRRLASIDQRISDLEAAQPLSRAKLKELRALRRERSELSRSAASGASARNSASDMGVESNINAAPSENRRGASPGQIDQAPEGVDATGVSPRTSQSVVPEGKAESGAAGAIDDSVPGGDAEVKESKQAFDDTGVEDGATPSLFGDVVPYPASRSYQRTSYKDIVGQPARSAEDIAAIGRRFADEPTETLRFIFVKDGKIVGHQAQTVELPDRAPLLMPKESPGRVFEKVKDRIRRLGADTYYMVHNHPSGGRLPSQADIRLTKQFRERLQDSGAQFGDHIVVSRGGWRSVDLAGMGGHDAAPVATPFDRPVQANGPVGVYLAVKDAGLPDRGEAAFVYLGAKNHIEHIERLPVSRANDQNFDRYLRNQARRHGATKIVAVAGPDTHAPKLRNGGYLTDYIGSDGQSAREAGTMAAGDILDPNPYTGNRGSAARPKRYFSRTREAASPDQPGMFQAEATLVEDLRDITKSEAGPGTVLRRARAALRGRTDEELIGALRWATNRSDKLTNTQVADAVTQELKARGVPADETRWRFKNLGGEPEGELELRPQVGRDGGQRALFSRASDPMGDEVEATYQRLRQEYDPALSDAYVRASAEHDAAARKLFEAQDEYRAGKMPDNEFLAIRQAEREALAKLEATSKRGPSSAARPVEQKDRGPQQGRLFSRASDQTETPEFKRWFGESKVVDKDGKPIVVYHGSGTKITQFDPALTGQGNDQLGSGFYFTTDRSLAKVYETATAGGGAPKLGGGDSPNTTEAFLAIKNPIRLSPGQENLRDVRVDARHAEQIIKRAPNIYDADESPLVDWIDNGGRQFTDADIKKVVANYDNLMHLESDFYRDNATAFRDAVRDVTGYDGVEKTFEDGTKHFVAWHPEQIKSATGNAGTFDPNKPDIRFSRASEPGQAQAFGPDGQAYDVRYRVVELDDLIASHDRDLRPNPSFPEELQPRDRTRAASQQQVAELTQKFDPERVLHDTKEIQTGIPVVGPDMVVESGNARTIAMQNVRGRRPQKWREYREAVKTRAEQYGAEGAGEIEKMRDPVLVRERVSGVDRAEFARLANEPGVATVSDSEAARSAAARLKDDALTAMDLPEGAAKIDDVLRQNPDVAASLLRSMPSAGRAAMMDAKGQLNRTGVERIKSAVFAKTYGGEDGAVLLSEFAEAAEPDMRNIQVAMMNSLPAIAKLEAMARAGKTDSALAIAHDVQRVARKRLELAREGLPVEGYLEQQTMFGRDLTEAQEALLRFFDDNKRSPNRIAEVLHRYAVKVSEMPPPSQSAMFATEKPTKRDILVSVLREQAEEVGGRTGTAASKAADALETAADDATPDQAADAVPVADEAPPGGAAAGENEGAVPPVDEPVPEPKPEPTTPEPDVAEPAPAAQRATASREPEPREAPRYAVRRDVIEDEIARARRQYPGLEIRVAREPLTTPDGGRARAYFDPELGIVEISPDIASAKDLREAILHEVVGHKGVRGVLGDELEQVMKRIRRHWPGQIRHRMNLWNTDWQEAAEEFLAEIAEKPGRDAGFVAEIIGHIRQRMSNVFKVDMSNKDVVYLLSRSRRFAEGRDARPFLRGAGGGAGVASQQ